MRDLRCMANWHHWHRRHCGGGIGVACKRCRTLKGSAAAGFGRALIGANPPGSCRPRLRAGPITRPVRAGVVLVGVCLVLAGCSAGEPVDQAATPPTDVTSLYEAVGNADAETVLVFAQGGPASELDANGFSLLTEDLNLDQLYVVNVHQAQTLDPDPFLTADIDFDAAKAADAESVQIASDVVAHFRASDKRVVVLGISFGASLVQDLLATQGNIADQYVIIVGRLDSPEAAWTPFSEGRATQFVGGTKIVEVPIERAGFGTGTPEGERNMARLVAGFDFKRYTELLAGVDLSNVIYGYGKTDDQVGRLSKKEIAFLDAAGAEVVSDPGGHVDAIFALTGPALADAL